MASIGLDFYSRTPPPRDVPVEVGVGASIGVLVGALLGALVVVFWQAVIPLGREMVHLDLALGVALVLATLFGICGGIAAYARAKQI